MSELVSARLPEEMLAAICRLQAQHGWSRSEAIRNLIEWGVPRAEAAPPQWILGYREGKEAGRLAAMSTTMTHVRLAAEEISG